MDEVSNRQRKGTTANKKHRPSAPASARFTSNIQPWVFHFFCNFEKFIGFASVIFPPIVHSTTKRASVAGVRRQKSKYVINPGHFTVSQMVIIKMITTITFINELGAILLPISPTCCSSPVTIGVQKNREERGRKMRPELAQKVPWTTLHFCRKHLSASSLFLPQPQDSLNNKIHTNLGCKKLCKWSPNTYSNVF